MNADTPIGELDALMRKHRMQIEYIGGGFRASAYDADYEITDIGCGPTLLDAVLTLIKCVEGAS